MDSAAHKMMNEKSLQREWLLVEAISGAIECKECTVFKKSELQVTVYLNCVPLSLEVLDAPGRAWDGVPFVDALLGHPFIPGNATFAPAQAFEEDVGFIEETNFSSPALYLLRMESASLVVRIFNQGRVIHSTPAKDQVASEEAIAETGWGFSAAFDTPIHFATFAEMLRDRAARLRIPTTLRTPTSLPLWSQDG